ncbi:MAG: metallophosphoesterase, partial [Bacteroidota bacterium]
MYAKTLLWIALLAFTACTGTKTSTSANADAEIIKFAILQLNDVYEISPLDEGRVGGMARVATIKKQLETAVPTVITVLDGDYLNPSLIGSLKCDFDGTQDRVNGRQMVEVMNALGVDYVCFGNHEFDLKEKDLLARNQESKFQIISSNVWHKTASGDVAFQQNGKDLPEYVVHTVKGKKEAVRLSFLGLCLNFNQVDYVTYGDPYADGRRVYEAAKKESDVVLALTHLTMDMDKQLAAKVPEIPLLLGGHEHVNMSAKVGNSAVYKADANAKTVYIHWCRYCIRTSECRRFWRWHR